MKKRLISMLLCLVLISSLACNVAFACDSCKSDSVELNPKKSITITGDGVNIRPHHRATNNAEDKPGGAAYYGDTGMATHKYPGVYNYTWVRAEMNSGINGWISADYVSFS